MVSRKLRDRLHPAGRTGPSPDTSTFPGVVAAPILVTTSPTSSLIHSTTGNLFCHASSLSPPSIPSGLLSLPVELILEIGYHIADTDTLNNLIRSHSALACILSRQLYYRAFNWDKRATIKSRFHCKSRANLQEYAMRGGYEHTLRVLLDWYGLDITMLHHNPGHAIAIMKGEHSIPSKGQRGPLHNAALKGHASICKILLERARAICSLQDTDEQDETPLHYAARSLCPSVVVAFLIDNGANVEAVNRFGRTPLHLAIELDSIDAVRALLEKGANPLATVRKMSCNIRDKAQNNEFSAMKLALDRKSTQDEGHLVTESRLNSQSNGKCVVELLAEYEVKANWRLRRKRWGRIKAKSSLLFKSSEFM
ncbi:ankyrin repeat-containing domain protein [Tirmania nivea]|nr:ankyrin repeat-containing domain protein [Tirmania nivea]